MDLRFPTDNPLEIPTLRADMQAEAGVDLPLLKWGSEARSRIMRGTYHFYTDDKYIEPLWSVPGKVPDSECLGAIEPNFSVREQTPVAVAIWQTYRKRWLARYWQERGVRIYVDLNVARNHAGLNLTGVPRGWKAYSTRLYAGEARDVEGDHADAVAHAGGPVLFLLYGGGEAGAEMARQRGWIWFQDQVSRVRDRDRTEKATWGLRLPATERARVEEALREEVPPLLAAVFAQAHGLSAPAAEIPEDAFVRAQLLEAARVRVRRLFPELFLDRSILKAE